MPVVNELSAASLFLEMLSNGTTIASGTGIVGVSSNGVPALLTARHNVTGIHADNGQRLDEKHGCVPDTIKIWHRADATKLGWVEKYEALYNDRQEPLWHEHPVHRDRVDVVALPLTELEGIKLPSSYGSEVPIFVGPSDGVSVIGFPFKLTSGGRLAIWANGSVASEPPKLI